MKNRHSLRTLLVTMVFLIMLLSSLLTGSSYIVLLAFGIIPFPFITQMTRPLFLLIVSSFIGTVMSAIISARFLRPIHDLISATRSISQGDFSVRVEEGDTIDEIDELQRSFNDMAVELGSIEMFREDFINNFSHEFKTPIVSIRGFARQLQREDLTDEQRREYAGIIAEESDRLANLASSILLLSKLENQNIVTDRQPFRVDEEVRKSILLLEKEWTAKEIDLQPEMDEITINDNAELLSHIWRNLIGNAIKFSPQGGALYINLHRAGKNVVFSVRDEGPGMDEETQKHIFDKFYQGDASHGTKGYGLGLALVKRIVTICAGTVEVKSAPGKGSEFIVTIPEMEESGKSK